MQSHAARVLDLLMELEPQLLSNKGTAAKVIADLADATGIVAAIVLSENGEETFQEFLSDIRKLIDKSAHRVGAPHLNDNEGSKIYLA